MDQTLWVNYFFYKITNRKQYSYFSKITDENKSVYIKTEMRHDLRLYQENN